MRRPWERHIFVYSARRPMTLPPALYIIIFELNIPTIRYMNSGEDPFTLCVPVAIFDRNYTIDLPKNRMIKKSNSESILLHFIA